MLSNEEIRAIYGPAAVVSRKGVFVLVHLDSPSAALVRRRTREFRPEDYFFDDCPLCQLLKPGGVVVFDDAVYEDDGDLTGL
jgi:hypothetical protein